MAKRGRKPKGEFSDNSSVTSIRIRTDIREALDRACEISGNSLGQEIQARVWRTFTEDDNIADVFGSRREYRLFRLISETMRTVAEREDVLQSAADVRVSWLDQPERYARAMHACIAILELIAPGVPDVSVDDLELLRDVSRTRGQIAAVHRLHDIAAADASLPRFVKDESAAKTALAKRDLGQLVERASRKYLRVEMGMGTEVVSEFRTQNEKKGEGQ